jgi:5-methylcytosine-specific restriction endonuclease McrA
MNHNLKLTAIKWMGGECVVCGYSSCARALHFHHINPHEKKNDISSLSCWYDIENELKKCVLLCANCHAEVHDGMIDHETLLMLAER